MSEKRFKAVDGGFKHIIEDKEQRRVYLMHIYEHNQKVVDLLNEQQATIKRLEEENDDLRFALRTEQAFTRVEKDKKPFLSKEEFLKELDDE